MMLTKNDFKTKYIIIHDDNFDNSSVFEYCVDDKDFEKHFEKYITSKTVKKFLLAKELRKYVDDNKIEMKEVHIIDASEKFNNLLNKGDKIFMYNEKTKNIINELEVKGITLMMSLNVEKTKLIREITYFLENKNSKIKITTSEKLLKENKYKSFIDFEKIENSNIKNPNIHFFFNKENAILKLEEYEDILSKRLQEIESAKKQLVDYEFSNIYNA